MKNNPGDGASWVLCSLGKAVYPFPLLAEMQDVKVYAALCEVTPLRRIYLIVQRVGPGARASRVGKLVVLYIPALKSKILNHMSFICRAILLGARLRKQHVNAVMSSEPTAAGVAGVFLKMILRSPLLVHLQGDVLRLPSAHFSRLRRVLSRFTTLLVCRTADRVRCVSRSIQTEAAKAGIDGRKLILVSSRCNTQEFDPNLYHHLREQTRRGWKLPTGPVILFVGALSIHKGVRWLLDALALLKAEGFVCSLVLVGAGERESQLRGQVQALGLDGRVRFCGRVPYREIPAHMAASDVLVLPSIDEGMPRVILEAMAMELPVVASRVGGIPELIDDRETGLLVEPANSQALAAALKQILSDAAKRRAMGRRGRERVVREFSFEKGIESYRALLTGMLR